MDKEDIAYCGLDCELCKSKFADIRNRLICENEVLTFRCD